MVMVMVMVVVMPVALSLSLQVVLVMRFYAGRAAGWIHERTLVLLVALARCSQVAGVAWRAISGPDWAADAALAATLLCCLFVRVAGWTARRGQLVEAALRTAKLLESSELSRADWTTAAAPALLRWPLAGDKLVAGTWLRSTSLPVELVVIVGLASGRLEMLMMMSSVDLRWAGIGLDGVCELLLELAGLSAGRCPSERCSARNKLLVMLLADQLGTSCARRCNCANARHQEESCEISVAFLGFEPDSPVEINHDRYGNIEGQNGRHEGQVRVGLDELDLALAVTLHGSAFVPGIGEAGIVFRWLATGFNCYQLRYTRSPLTWLESKW